MVKAAGVITLTVNPAIDLHLRADSLDINRDNLACIERRDMGGKGVNVSRALLALGQKSLCAVVVGRDNAAEFMQPLTNAGIDLRAITVSGAVRENINIHTPLGDTVIATEGPRVDANTVAKLGELIEGSIGEGTVLCFSGRISESSDKAQILSLLQRMKDRGARLVVDSKSLTLSDIRALGPHLIKPNREEAELLLGSRLCTEGDIKRAVGELMSYGCDAVLMTLGADGAVLGSPDGVYRAAPCEVRVLSTTGAGDSSLGGYILALLGGYCSESALRLASACGAAACEREGTLPPDPCRVKELIDKVSVVKI